MGELFDCYNAEPTKGKDITIGDRFPMVFISDRDEVFCYLGVQLYNDIDKSHILCVSPHHICKKHSTDTSVAKKIKGFYRLVGGCIILDEYVDGDYQKEHLYKKLNVSVRLATPGSCYYGIWKSYAEEEEVLTRKVFGLTYDELTSLLEVYAKAMNTHYDSFAYPKLTRSVQSDHFCDISELWIPRTFPYVAFTDSGYDFSHVSLFGFYRHLQLLVGYNINAIMRHVLIKFGLSEDLLQRVLNIGKEFYYQTKVTENIIR